MSGSARRLLNKHTTLHFTLHDLNCSQWTNRQDILYSISQLLSSVTHHIDVDRSEKLSSTPQEMKVVLSSEQPTIPLMLLKMQINITLFEIVATRVFSGEIISLLIQCNRSRALALVLLVETAIVGISNGHKSEKL